MILKAPPVVSAEPKVMVSALPVVKAVAERVRVSVVVLVEVWAKTPVPEFIVKF